MRACVCGNCSTWTRHSDERMPDHGECSLRGAGYYTHKNSGCVIKPVRWSANPNSKKKACA